MPVARRRNRRRTRITTRLRRALKRASRRIRGTRSRGILAVGAFGSILALFACVAEEREPTARPTVVPGEPTVRVLLVESATKVKVAVDGPCQLVPTPGEPLLLEQLAPATVMPGDGTGMRLAEPQPTRAPQPPIS